MFQSKVLIFFRAKCQSYQTSEKRQPQRRSKHLTEMLSCLSNVIGLHKRKLCCAVTVPCMLSGPIVFCDVVGTEEDEENKEEMKNSKKNEREADKTVSVNNKPMFVLTSTSCFCRYTLWDMLLKRLIWMFSGDVFVCCLRQLSCSHFFHNTLVLCRLRW